MLLDEIGSIVREHEEEVLFDVEAPAHWYEVEFKNNKVTLYEIDEYHFNGDEWGEIETSTVYDELETFYNCSLKDFTNFVIQFFETKMLYREHSYPQEAYVYDKIIIRSIKND